MKDKTYHAAGETAGMPADSQSAERPLKTSHCRGGFLSATPDLALGDSQAAAANPPLPPPFSTAVPGEKGAKSTCGRVEYVPQIGPYLEGRLCVALGLTQREAEHWCDHTQTTISRLVRLDKRFAQDVPHFTRHARLHSPHFRTYMTNQKSWPSSSVK